MLFWMACTFQENAQNTTTNETHSVTTKEVKEVRYIDGGVVTRNPRIRNISIIINDSTNAQLSYQEYIENMGGDTTRGSVKVPTTRLDLLYENMVKLADIPDGIEIMPGKVPCVGKRGIDVSVIFNTGDTSHFRINGGALCDSDVIPEWKLIDSLSFVIYNESLVKQ